MCVRVYEDNSSSLHDLTMVQNVLGQESWHKTKSLDWSNLSLTPP